MSVLVFATGFVLSGTPWALVVANDHALPPLRDEDVVLVRRGAPTFEPGQILWIAQERRQRLPRLMVVGPGSIPGEKLAHREGALTEAERAWPVSITEQQIVIALRSTHFRLDRLGRHPFPRVTARFPRSRGRIPDARSRDARVLDKLVSVATGSMRRTGVHERRKLAR